MQTGIHGSMHLRVICCCACAFCVTGCPADARLKSKEACHAFIVNVVWAHLQIVCVFVFVVSPDARLCLCSQIRQNAFRELGSLCRITDIMPQMSHVFISTVLHADCGNLDLADWSVAPNMPALMEKTRRRKPEGDDAHEHMTSMGRLMCARQLRFAFAFSNGKFVRL